MPNERITSRLELAAQADAVRWARRHTRDVLSAWRVNQEQIDNAQLAVSELVTNAVRHSADQSLETLPTRLTLTLQREETRILVLVADPNNQPPVRSGLPDLGAENGRGLLLVQTLAKEWSYYFLPTGGKVVWCSIELT
ncbi:ATP-binding protein [Streptomyces sp. YIM S03343]